MDLFPVGSFVRLRSRARRGKYLHADEDAVHVYLRSLGDVPSLHGVWKVDHWPVEGDDDDLLLLQGAGYGKYLAVAHVDEVVPSGYRGVRAFQRNYDSPDLDPSFAWRPVRVEAGQNYVRLYTEEQPEQRCLRANGRYRRWKKRVTVDVRNGNETTMMQWMVEPLPSTPEPLPLPPPPPASSQVRRGLFRRHDVRQDLGRRIRIVRDDDEDWPEFISYVNSVSHLRDDVRHVVRLEDGTNITLCVRAGMNARVIPLVTDLPASNLNPIDIVVYTTGSPAAAELRYPQL